MLWLPLAEAGMVTGGLLALWILPQSRFYWTQWRSLLGERRRRRRESEAAPAEFEFEQQTVGHDIVGPGWWACSVTMRSGDTALSVHGKGEQVSKVASPALHRLADELFVSSRPYVVVPINLADDEFRDPWEQDLGRVTSSVRGKMPLWVRFRNRVPGTAEWNVVLRSTPSWPGDGQYTGPASLRPAPLDLSETCALFLIGTPVFTSAGWHMRVEDADGVSSADPYRKTGRGTYSGERLVAPREVGQASATLVVLQLAPVEGDPQPLGRFREGMCGLAREFLDLGFTVMVVPALPDDLAAHVVAMVAGSKRRLTNAARVLDLYHDVRAAIMAREIVASAQDERASLDVLLMI
jgi:hypothetical protein